MHVFFYQAKNHVHANRRSFHEYTEVSFAECFIKHEDFEMAVTSTIISMQKKNVNWGS